MRLDAAFVAMVTLDYAVVIRIDCCGMFIH